LRWYVVYETLRERSSALRNVGDSLSSARVYYSARDRLSDVACVTTRGKDTDKQTTYRGKINRGDCVDASDREAGHPRGLSGKRIRFECQEKPGDATVYQRTSTHKGMCGLLEGGVTCRILESYTMSTK